MAETSSPRLTRASHVWTVLAAVACLLPLLLQLPAHVSAGIAIVAIAVGGSSWKYRPPGWMRLLLSLSLLGIVLATFGFSFGRDTGCALLAAMLALKPVELPTVRDARSLLGFALFAPFATFLLDQGALSLLLGLAGALLVLAAMTRLAEQDVGDVAEIGDARTATDAGSLSTRQRLSMVLRLVAIGLPLALAAFWLFPRIASPLWGVPELSQARPGLSDEMSPGQWLDLMGDDTPALRVQFFGPTPAPDQMYWRGPVLSDFDGRTWSRSLWLRAQPAASVTHARSTWDYEVEIEPTDRPQLLALDLLRDAPAGSRLSHEHSLLAEQPLRSVSRWRLRSSPAVRFEPDLPPTLRQLMLHLPEGYNPRSVALARNWRGDFGNDDAAIVEHALQWIRGEFGYTLSTPLPGRHVADEFLFDWKQGFCEHYSSAFAILMRAAGIPTRVVTGYVGGYRNTFGNYWVVRRMDAHAWNEVWLQGRGWVRVDPTAAVAPERVYDTIEDRLGGGLGNRTLSPMFDASDWMRRGWNDLVLGFNATRQEAILKPLGLSGTGARGLAGLFALMAMLTLGWMLWLSARGEREHDVVLRAWHQLQARYARRGLAPDAHEPAADWVRRITRLAGPDPDLQALSQRFVEWRYARGQGDVDGQRTLVRDLRRHRPHLRIPRPA
ncbi:transglutaminase TgpA family protein [Luteimonas sp. RIT-PG2_3]